MNDNERFRDWEERAEAGDGQFAIALALQNVVFALRALGNGNAATQMGAIEGLSVHIGEKIEGLSEAVNNISIESVADAMSEIGEKIGVLAEAMDAISTSMEGLGDKTK